MPKKLACLTKVSNELANDSSPVATALVGESIACSVSREFDRAFFAEATSKGPAGLESLVSAGGSAKIREFEHGPRLCRSTTGFSEEQYEATRQRRIAAACQQLKERGVGSPRERYEANEPFTFQRWTLGGNMFNGDYIREHPLVADRFVRWLQVDADDTVTLGESPLVAR